MNYLLGAVSSDKKAEVQELLKGYLAGMGVGKVGLQTLDNVLSEMKAANMTSVDATTLQRFMLYKGGVAEDKEKRMADTSNTKSKAFSVGLALKLGSITVMSKDAFKADAQARAHAADLAKQELHIEAVNSAVATAFPASNLVLGEDKGTPTITIPSSAYDFTGDRTMLVDNSITLAVKDILSSAENSFVFTTNANKISIVLAPDTGALTITAAPLASETTLPKIFTATPKAAAPSEITGLKIPQEFSSLLELKPMFEGAKPSLVFKEGVTVEHNIEGAIERVPVLRNADGFNTLEGTPSISIQDFFNLELASIKIDSIDKNKLTVVPETYYTNAKFVFSKDEENKFTLEVTGLLAPLTGAPALDRTYILHSP